ncbi:MAG: ATP-binding protein [Granulosicoccus sp.]
MQSIKSRLTIGSSIVLAIFVVLVALSVSYSVHQRANTARFDRMQGLIYGILGATEITDDASLLVNTLELPDQRLNQSTAGLYAELVASDGTRLWQSKSTSNWLPDIKLRPIGDWLFETTDEGGKQPLHRLQLATAWQFDNGEELPFIVHVVDEADALIKQLRRFDQSLWATLLGSAVLLLIVQLFVLRYSLKPLHQIGEQVAAIERGERDIVSDEVPKELSAMTMGLNALLRSERERHAQYRHLLDDLAHSLKTPLSVLQNLAGQSNSEHEATILAQTRLMRTTIDRHSQRATIRSPRYLAPAITVSPIIERIATSLRKLYNSPNVSFSSEVDRSFQVRVDEADLYEVLGNVLENSCKYGAQNIIVSVDSDKQCLSIDDDGPGFPAGQLSQLTQRGVRADSQAPGTGMGLAASQQLMESYGGQLKLQHAPEGGARVLLIFA